MHHLIGIDIGMGGAVAFVTPEGRPLHVTDMPVTRDDGDNRVDARGLVAVIRATVRPGDTALALVENIRPRPEGNKGRHGNTIHSQGSLMRQRGAIEAVLDCLGYPIRWVEPQTWKRSYGLIGKDKDASRQTALTIYRGDPICALLMRKKDDGRAEALLLARYLQGMQ
jgi:hypothetical protein